MERTSNLDIILAATDGNLFVTLPQIAKLTPWAEKTLRNRPAAFPIPLKRMGNRVGIPAVELAAYLDQLAGVVPDSQATEAMKKVGRPPNHKRVGGRQ